MKKYLVLLGFLPFFLPSTVSASLVKVASNGDVIISVLASEDSTLLSADKEIEVKRIASEEASTNSNIVITKVDGKVNMRVGMEKNFDVTSWKDDLVEIDARSSTNKIKIAYVNGTFLISEDTITASTDLPIIIDPESGEFILETSIGRKSLEILPKEAAKSALKTKLINRIGNDPLKIVVGERELSYVVVGEKVINILSYYDFRFPISAKISAITGEIESIESPEWLRFLSIIFV